MHYHPRYLMEGDFFIGASMATTLTKLALRFVQQISSTQIQNQFCAEAMLVITAILHLGRSGLPQKPISNDDAARLGLCLKVSHNLENLCEQFNNFCFVVKGAVRTITHLGRSLYRCLSSFNFAYASR